jgi:uncharacterized protein (TIGR03000 family)
VVDSLPCAEWAGREKTKAAVKNLQEPSILYSASRATFPHSILVPPAPAARPTRPIRRIFLPDNHLMQPSGEGAFPARRLLTGASVGRSSPVRGFLLGRPTIPTAGRDILPLHPGEADVSKKHFWFGGALFLACTMMPAPRGALAEEMGPAGDDDVEPSTAVIRMHVPFNAELWFEGKKMASTGVVRRFETPPLTPGAGYLYEIRARWRWGKRKMSETRTITVHAGDRINLSFPTPPVVEELAEE